MKDLWIISGIIFLSNLVFYAAGMLEPNTLWVAAMASAGTLFFQSTIVLLLRLRKEQKGGCND